MNEKQYIDKSQWTSLPGDVRFKLRQAFYLRITEPTEVVNDTVISDGVSQDSIRNTFSVSKMRVVLNVAEGTCDELFGRLVELARNGGLESELKEPTPAQPPTQEPTKVEKKKRTRK